MEAGQYYGGLVAGDLAPADTLQVRRKKDPPHVRSARCASTALAFNSVTGAVYCLGPLTLFLMAWLLTRLPGYSFAARLCLRQAAQRNAAAGSGELFQNRAPRAQS